MRRRDDGGNLMLLAGIVVTIAFVTTALTLSQVSALERQASSKPVVTLASEWRFLRDRIAASVETGVTPLTTADALRQSILPAVSATFRGVETEKGFDVSIRLATTLETFNRTEAHLLDPPLTGTSYDAVAVNGGVVDWEADDDVTDGILWRADCQDVGGTSEGCIGAVFLSVHLSNGVSSLHEIILIRTNAG